MSKHPYMKLYVGDFQADTMHLDTTEVGAYLLLIMAMWKSSDRNLPNDDKILGRITKIHDYRVWKRVKPAILKFFTLSEDGAHIMHKRIALELDLADKSSSIAQAKALKRWKEGYAAGRNHSQEEDIEPHKGVLSSSSAGPRARSANGYAPRTPRRETEKEKRSRLNREFIEEHNRQAEEEKRRNEQAGQQRH